MVSNTAFTVSALFKDNISKGVNAALSAIRGAGKGTFNQISNEIKRTNAQLKTFGNSARKAARELNAALGGRIFNAAGQANNLGQNISSISNRLGFMAFQWNFMANAASRAVDTVVGGLKNIIIEGAAAGDALTRALSFATSAQGIRDQTAAARADIEGLRDIIFQEGSGKNIFGIDQISNTARELAKALTDPKSVKTILPFVSQLKTIDPDLNDEKIGSGLISLFETLGTDTNNIEEVAAAMDFLSNVSDKSTANFQSSIASLGVAAQQAKTIGITAFETGAIIQNVSDVLARNVGGGRASATAGHYANAFFSQLNSIADDETKSGKFARLVGLNIFEKDIKTNQTKFKDLVGIVGEFRKQLDPLAKGDRAAFLSKLGITGNAQETLNALLTKNNAELREQVENLKERGLLEVRAAASATSAQAQILRIKAAIDSLKITISDGFAPALYEIANQMSAIAGAPEFRRLMAEIGKIMSQQLIPVIKEAFKYLKIFLKFLSDNKKTLRLVISGVLALTAALLGLQVIATIGFFALVAGASIAGMTGQMFLAGAAATALRAGFATLFTTIIPLALAGLGFALVALSLTDIFDSSLRPAIFAIGGALATLGVGLAFFKDEIKAAFSVARFILSDFLTNIGKGQFSQAFTGLGQQSKIAFTDQLSGIKGKTSGLLQSLGGLKGVGIGAAIAIGVAFAVWLNNAVQNSPVFQGGLSDYWDEAGFQLKAAVGKTARAIGEIFQKIGSFIYDIFKGIAEAAGRVLGAVFEFLSNPFDPARWEKLKKVISETFDPTNFNNFVKALSDPNFLATERLTEVFQRLREQISSGKVNKSLLDPAKIKEIIDSIQDTTGSTLTPSDIIKAVNEGFGGPLLTDIIGPLKEGADAYSINIQSLTGEIGSGVSFVSLSNQAIADNIAILTTQSGILEEASEIVDETKEHYVDLSESLEIGTDFTDKNNDVISDSITTVKENINSVDLNSFNTNTDTNTLAEKIDFQKLQILEIAKNINSVAAMTVRTEQVNLAMAKFAIELTEAARRVASLKVSDDGKFSISGRKTSTTFNEIGPLASIIKQQAANVGFAERQFQEGFINIDNLSKSLDALTTQLATQTAAAAAKEAATQTGLGLDTAGKLNTISAGGGTFVLTKALDNGVTQIDINVDGTFDINVQQGGLTPEQISFLTQKIGTSLTNAIKAQLGVQT